MRCDFSSVAQTFFSFIGEGKSVNQIKFVSGMFAHFLESNEDFELDNGQICRWLKGASAVSPKIAAFYLQRTNKEYLSVNIEDNILPLIYDLNKFAEELYNLTIMDISISEKKRAELTVGYPPEEDADIADLAANVVVFTLERKFEKRDKKALSTSGISPVITDLAYIESVPKPCKYFCGRDTELAELHNLLQTKGKVFISGIAGIGKSELAKAYAYYHRKEYSSTLFLSYGGSLFNLIADMDFVEDHPEDDAQTRFRKHNRILRTMKENSLIIIDNFNTTASDEVLLDVILKYTCRVIFTTRSRFELGTTLELGEIESVDTLVDLSGKFYLNALEQSENIEKIIDVIHHHTLSVELSARLLQKGLSEPAELFNKLTGNSVNPHLTDKIRITKDGLNLKDTYFNHLHKLFSLYLLDDEMQTIMRCLTFAPTSGIRSRMFAKWLQLDNLNGINDLIELGFIQEREFDVIALLPIVRDICFEDLKPDYSNCSDLINSIHEICLRHGEDILYANTLFAIVENIIKNIVADNIPTHLLFMQDCFAYMEKYRYESGMRLIASELKKFKEYFTDKDLAILYYAQSACAGLLDKDYPKAVELCKKAVNACVPEENPVLAANLYMNLGVMYEGNRQLDLAEENMKTAIGMLSSTNLYVNDVITMTRHYAQLFAETKRTDEAVFAM